jgi:uncharacterized protein YhfF
MWPRVGEMRGFELGAPGASQDRLNGLVLAGEKRATAGLWQQDYVGEGEALDEVGERQALLDGEGKVIAILEITKAELTSFGEVTWAFAEAEGEGFTDIEDWREAHRSFWESIGVEIDDDTPVVCVEFEVVDEVGTAGD